LSYYRSILSKDEVERAGRFVFEKDRNHYIAGRGLLRVILGSYLDLEPSQPEFVYGPYGKPALKLGLINKALEFNLSHSKDRALYAFNWNRRIGVDIEYLIPMADMDDFAERFFAPRESAWINSLSGTQKEDAFFKTWTCKEAFLKANGSGLTVPINHVEISLETEGVVELISIGDDKEQPKHWRLEMFNPFPGYQAALAIEGHAGHIIFQPQ
jgi:4'-phosphopantetheinyl transferase